MVSKEEIIAAQEKWAESIIEIGASKEDRKACEEKTKNFLKELYAFDQGEVLFKPTKVSQFQFRKNMKAAQSYFIARDEHYPEDAGFALEPWRDIRFENTGFVTDEDRALAMGNYYFKASDKEEIKVEYTFSYVRNSLGKIKINLHHSSLPFGA